MKKREDAIIRETLGQVFYTEISTKFDKDLATVEKILANNPEELTELERYTLINILGTSYHDSGKIEGVTSIDGSAHGCAFCEKMRQAAAGNPAHICGGCYDYKQENDRVNVENRHKLNLVILSTVRFTVEELKMLTMTQIGRINSSGDIQNEIHAENAINIGYAFKWANIALWAKNVPAVQAAAEKLGKPENMIFIQSSPIIGRPAQLAKWFDYTFTVYPDKKTTAAAIANGACACNGKKCRECGYKCYFGAWAPGSDIAELLKNVTNEKRKEIVAFLETNF